MKIHIFKKLLWTMVGSHMGILLNHLKPINDLYKHENASMAQMRFVIKLSFHELLELYFQRIGPWPILS